MNKYFLYSLLFVVIASTPASSQDLDLLKDRASQVWKERLLVNKSRELRADPKAAKESAEAAARAAGFIEKEGRADFPTYENVREATVAGLEFTADKSKVLVTTKTKTFIPAIGIADQTIIESWVWKSGNWFVHVEPVVGSSFQAPGAMSGIAVRPGFTFQLVDKKVDLGAHKQGDKIGGTVKFVAARSELQNIRARGLDGFRIVATRWTDDKNGEFEFNLDSSLISQDIDASVVLEAIGPERGFQISTVIEKLTLVGRIEGTIRISQLPQTPAAEKDRFVELEVENVGKAPLRILSFRPLSGNFVDANPMPPPLAPGETGKLRISYPTQTHLADGELIIQLSEGILPSNSVLFRIKGPVAQSADKQLPAPPDRSQVDAAVRKALEEAERARARQ